MRSSTSVGAHLAVGGDGLHFRNLLAQPFLDVGQVGDARHDEEALPAAKCSRSSASRSTTASHGVT